MSSRVRALILEQVFKVFGIPFFIPVLGYISQQSPSLPLPVPKKTTPSPKLIQPTPQDKTYPSHPNEFFFTPFTDDRASANGGAEYEWTGGEALQTIRFSVLIARFDPFLVSWR
jgi:hypothetical protein